MRCEEFIQVLEAYRDGELDPAGQATALEHLQSCPACRQALESRNVWGAEIKENLGFHAPADLKVDLKTELQAKVQSDLPDMSEDTDATQHAGRHRWNIWQTGLAAAAVVSVALVAWWLTDRTHPSASGEAFSRPSAVSVLRFSELTNRDDGPVLGGLILDNHL